MENQKLEEALIKEDQIIGFFLPSRLCNLLQNIVFYHPKRVLGPRSGAHFMFPGSKYEPYRWIAHLSYENSKKILRKLNYCFGLRNTELHHIQKSDSYSL